MTATETSHSAESIYDDGAYLDANQTWHSEDSPYKARLVMEALIKSGSDFKSALDIGCGAGLVTEILANKMADKHFTGNDSSKVAQLLWTKRVVLPNLQFSTADPLSGTKCFDLIMCLDVFEHVEDVFGFLRGLRGVGRKFIFNIPLDMNAIKVATGGIRKAREQVGHLHYFNEYSAIQTLENCGYTILWTKLSVAYLANLPQNWKQALAWPFRCLSLILGKRVAARLSGGMSLVVVAT